MKKLFPFLVCSVLLVGGCAIGSSSAPAPPVVVSVGVSPATASVPPGLTAQFAATVSNDTANKGVTWSVNCSAAQCGSISPSATASGAPTTYTAPAPLASNLTVTITAASVTDGSKTATAAITVSALTVAVTPPSATVSVQGTQPFTATVTNDASNKGVSWTLTQGGANCSPGCGTIAPATTASGSAATYTAPASVPANANVTIVATSVADANISATAAATINGVGISVSPATADVTVNATQQFTAMVTNDVSNKGVSWTLTQSGTPCSPSCGTINPASTASGVATTYTAPPSAPSPAQVTLTASSVANATESATATVTVTPPISVSVSPATAGVLVGTTQQFTATVSDDASNGGVSWSLTQGGTNCSPTCGTVSPASSPSGTPVTYAAPSGVPTPAGVTITATSVADTTKSASTAITVTGPCGAGSEVLLNGQYAFLLQGFDASGPVAIAGSFDADGAGNIAKTVGAEDINRASGAQTNLSIVSAGSSYSVGSDHRGCLTLVNSAGTTTTFRFALGSVSGTANVASKGRIIEFDDATGMGTRVASGELRLQDPSSFSNAQLSGPYTFGFYGQENGGSRFAVAGTFTSSGSGQVTGGTFDQNEGGTVTSDVPITGGTYNIASNGRGTIGITAIGVTNHFAIYMIDSSDAFFASMDSFALDPIFSGEALGSTATPFTLLSLNGSAVLHLTGDSSKSGTNAVLALAVADGLGNLTSFQIFQDTAGTFTSQTTTGTYAVEPNGRVTLTAATGLNSPLVLYLSGQNQGFALGTGTFSEIGRMEPQSGGPFSNASFSGAYFFGVETPAHPLEEVEVGSLTANSSAGTITATSDQANVGSGVLAPDQTANYTFMFSPDGTGNIGGTGSTTVIFISTGRLAYMANTQSLPSVIIIEQ